MAEIFTYTYNLNLDLSTHPINSITIKQYGKNTYYLNISVTQKGVVYIIDPASYHAYFKMKTPDKRYIYQLCEIDESGRVICELPESAAWASGVGEAEIEVIKNDGTVRMSTCSFEVIIDPSAYPEEEITGSNDFSALVDYVSQAGNMDQQVQEAQEAAETASSAQTAVTEMKTTIEGWKTAMQADKTDTEEAKNTAVEAQASALQSAQSASADAEELSSMLSTAMAMYNGPLTASDVSQMTDHTKVYVFTGTDVAGMNKGDWYYWDNSATAWVSGGQYLAGEITVDDTLTQTGQAADAKKTGDEITSIKSDLEQMDPGLSVDARDALVAVLQRIVYTDPRANDYYNALVSELHTAEYPKITAVFNPGSHSVYEGDSLDSLKPYLTVKYFVDASSSGTIVNDYTLSGTIEEGDQIITVRYSDYRTTFTVSVTNPFIYRLPNTPITFDGNTGIDTGISLLSEDRSFTLAWEFIDKRNYTKDTTQSYSFACYVPNSPYIGIFMQVYDGGVGSTSTRRKIRHVLRCTPPGSSGGGQVIFDNDIANADVVGRIIRFCFRYDSTTGTVKALLAVNKGTVTRSSDSVLYTYTAIDRNLIIGARKGTAELSNFMLGVCNDFKVFDSALSDADMQAYVEGVA